MRVTVQLRSGAQLKATSVAFGVLCTSYIYYTRKNVIATTLVTVLISQLDSKGIIREWLRLLRIADLTSLKPQKHSIPKWKPEKKNYA